MKEMHFQGANILLKIGSLHNCRFLGGEIAKHSKSNNLIISYHNTYSSPEMFDRERPTVKRVFVNKR